ncbi:MAG: flippase-like domain-containing protein [Gemmatimonadota bacterium]|nr:flippase-like domain-containing protein [Gemmatimonadota bacterium]
MKPRVVRAVRLGVIAVLLVGMLAYVRRVPWMPAIATMRHASLALLVLALCLHFVALTGKAGIWWTFLRPLGGPRFTTVARGTLMGATLNSLFVGSSGEAGRVLLMSRLTGIPSASVLATVVLERAVDLCGFLTLLACAVLLFPAPRALGIGASVVLGIVVVALAHWARGAPVGRHTAAPAASHSVLGRCRRYVQRVVASTREIATTRRVAIAFALTLLDWCSELASYSLIAYAAHFPIGVRGSLLALLAVNVGFLVRVTPGNVGVFELVYASVAHSLGFPTDVAIGVALMLHLVQDVPTTVLGLALGRRFFASSASETARTDRPPDAARPPAALPSSTAPYMEPARGTSS